MNSKYVKKFYLFTLMLLVFSLSTVSAQSTGNFSIKENGSVTIFGQHNFSKGSGLVPAGKVMTERAGEKGYLNFSQGSSWVGASDVNYVDGYVQVFHDEPFVFPVGDKGVFRPIAITGAANTTAAYYAKDPTEEFPHIPANGSTLGRVNNKEYWDITGSQPTKIALSWTPASNIANLAGGSLQNLRIIGWKGTQWEEIPSTVKSEAISLLVDRSTNLSIRPSLENGAIAASVDVIPDDYDYFTFGAISDENRTRADLAATTSFTYPNPVQSELTVDLSKFKGDQGTISVYNLQGKLMMQHTFKNGLPDQQQLDASELMNGMYKIYVRIQHQQYSDKFIVERLY